MDKRVASYQEAHSSRQEVASNLCLLSDEGFAFPAKARQERKLVQLAPSRPETGEKHRLGVYKLSTGNAPARNTVSSPDSSNPTIVEGGRSPSSPPST